jgi:hypothetical protein
VVLFARIALALAGALLLGGCASLQALQGGGLVAPKVHLGEVVLAESPPRRQVEAYLCPRVLRLEGRAGSIADAVCTRLFGRPPPVERLAISFDVHLRVENPNTVPLPLGALLTAVTVFPDVEARQTGTACVELCAPDDPACSRRRGREACARAPGDLRSIEDFPTALGNLLVVAGVAVDGGGPGFRLPRIAAGAELPVVARLGFHPEALLPVLEQVVRQSVAELERGRLPSLAIPYRLEGTVFADAGSVGRLAAGFGPTAGTWTLPAEGLTRGAPARGSVPPR